MSMITASLAPPHKILSQLNSDAAHRLETVLDRVQSAIAPVWPLQDFVAVNPFVGMAERPFHVVRDELQSVSDCELLMPLAYYRQQWEQGAFDRNHVAAAREELMVDGILLRVPYRWRSSSNGCAPLLTRCAPLLPPAVCGRD